MLLQTRGLARRVEGGLCQRGGPQRQGCCGKGGGLRNDRRSLSSSSVAGQSGEEWENTIPKPPIIRTAGLSSFGGAGSIDVVGLVCWADDSVMAARLYVC